MASRTMEQIMRVKIEYTKQLSKNNETVLLDTHEEQRDDYWGQRVLGTPENAFMQDILILNKQYAKDFGYKVAI